MPHSTDQRIREEISAAPVQRSNSVRVPGLSVQECWELWSDSDLAKRYGNEPRVVFQRIPIREGLALRRGETVEENPMQFEEDHYEWDEGRWMTVRGRFLNGPLVDSRYVFLFSFG